MAPSFADSSLDIEALTKQRFGRSDGRDLLAEEPSVFLYHDREQDSVLSTGPQAGSRGTDLTLSELDTNDQTLTFPATSAKPFSLLAHPKNPPKVKKKEVEGRWEQRTGDGTFREDVQNDSRRMGEGFDDNVEYEGNIFGEAAEDTPSSRGDTKAAETKFANALQKQEARRQANQRRDDRLHSDLYVLRKINSSFAVLNDALKDVGSANEVCWMFS